MATYKYFYSSAPEAEEQMLDDLFRVLKEHDLSEEDTNKFTLAVSEAFINALVHGNKQNSQKKIEVKLDLDEETLSAEIIDEGKEGLKQIWSRIEPPPLSESGRGIDLIRHYATTSQFTQTPSGGLKVTLSLARQVKQNISS
ncbi:MAG: ATP-binding protein [candidate division Zixibacteria bacterium]|nr:ATP-binding protein [candidate division Zixibacteria bacterium]